MDISDPTPLSCLSSEHNHQQEQHEQESLSLQRRSSRLIRRGIVILKIFAATLMLIVLLTILFRQLVYGLSGGSSGSESAQTTHNLEQILFNLQTISGALDQYPRLQPIEEPCSNNNSCSVQEHPL